MNKIELSTLFEKVFGKDNYESLLIMFDSSFNNKRDDKIEYYELRLVLKFVDENINNKDQLINFKNYLMQEIIFAKIVIDNLEFELDNPEMYE